MSLLSDASLLPRSFYQRDALTVAYDLIGSLIRRDDVILRITEVEAYRYPNDSANHCHKGKTKRNAPMWEAGGVAYIYLCYGMHNMFNIVTNSEGEGAAVLIRSCQPVSGIEIIASRRGGRTGPDSLTGPGKVGAALNIDRTWCSEPLFRSGGVELHRGEPPLHLATGPRIGIDYAKPQDARAPWRVAQANSVWVSHRNRLRVSWNVTTEQEVVKENI